MSDPDYRDILQSVRILLQEMRYSSMDERIVSNMKGSQGAFWDLQFYLKHLQEEIRLHSDIEYRAIMQRVGKFVKTESGKPIEGIRIEFLPEEADRYQLNHLDIVPSREMGRIAEEIGILLKEIETDYNQKRDIDNDRGPDRGMSL